MDPLYIAVGIAFIWLVVISFFLFKTLRHYKKLTHRTGSDSIDKVLDALVSQGTAHEEDIDEIKKSLIQFDDRVKTHLQKVGFVKFNPFDRVGGEQSFVIALLNQNDSGIVKTYLYTREGMRVYVKPVKEGKSEDYELSDEEKKAIKSALS